jgi:nitrogen fixation NifU-like protein
MSLIGPDSVTDEDLANLEKAGYSKKAIMYFLEQTNLGAIDDPDIKHIEIGECGDIMILFANLCEGPVLQEMRFRYAGCPALAASGASMIELAKGRCVSEAERITEKDIMDDVEGLPEDHLHCPALAVRTLRGALDALKNRRLLSKEEHGDYIHLCGLSGRQVDAMPVVRCENCPMVKECEADHIILRERIR